jgi:hypothetical protein
MYHILGRDERTRYFSQLMLQDVQADMQQGTARTSTSEGGPQQPPVQLLLLHLMAGSALRIPEPQVQTASLHVAKCQVPAHTVAPWPLRCVVQKGN